MSKKRKVDMSITLRPEHAWNLDVTLASVLEQGLTMLLNGYAEQDAGMERARDVFGRYALKWDNGMEEELWDASSAATADVKWALKWLRRNFQGMWD